MTKRILSLLLAAMMVLGSIIVVSAAEEEIDYDVENAFAIDVLKDINVLQGYDEDDFALDAAIKRYEMSLFIARALTGKTKDTYWEGAKNETPFTDLDGFKYAGSTTWTYNHGIILGKDNKTFDPNGYITYQEAIAMVLRAWADYYVKGGLKTLGIDDSIHYPWRHIELVEYLGLDENVDPETKYTDVLSRGAVAQLIFNLLTWSSEDFKALETNGFQFATDATMAEEKFGLELSPAEGVLVEILDAEADEETGLLSNKKFKDDLTEDGSIEGLSADHFADFEVEVEEDVYYNIVYFTRHEVEYNPFTGEAMIVEDGDVVTVVLSIEKVTIDDLVYTNAVGVTPEYTVQTEVTKKKDDGTVEEMAIVSITAGGVVYPLLAKDEDDTVLKLQIMTGTDGTAAPVTGFGSYTKDSNKQDKLVGVAKGTIEGIVKNLTPFYADLRVEDTDGDGEADTLTVVPYVFAGVYTEVETKATDDKKATTWELSNYALVLMDKASAAGATWEKASKNADGEYKNNFVVPTATAYAVKDSVKTIVEATTVMGTLTAYDIRDGKANYITIGETKLNTQYKDLAGWNASADYHSLAADKASLFVIYENKEVEDEDLAENQVKYLKAWVIDGNIVALAGVSPEGEEVEDTPVVTPDTVYTGIVDFDGSAVVNNTPVTTAFPTISGDLTIDSELVKLVDGKYYLLVNAFVDGVYTINLPLYLADETKLVYTSGNQTQQYSTWLSEENKKVDNAFDALTHIAGSGLAFYTTDSLGNLVVPYAINADGTYKSHDAVDEEAYFEFVSNKVVVAPASKTEGTTTTWLEAIEGGVKYFMDTRCDDYLEYVISATGKIDQTKYADCSADANTHWLFVGLNDKETKVAFGIPEYASAFTAHDNEYGRSIIKNGNMIVVFVDNLSQVKNFNYSMHADALYAIADSANTKLLDKGIRDGKLYFSVQELFADKTMEIVVDEDSALANTLRKIAEGGSGCYIVAVNDKHELLELYGIEAGAVNAIAQLTGDNALVIKQNGTAAEITHSGIDTKAELETAIKTRFNLTTVGMLNMSKAANLVYTYEDGKLVLNSGMPLFSDDADVYVFFTPATAKEAAKYVAFIYEPVGSTLDADTAFANALAAKTPVINLNGDIDLATINVIADTIINLNGYTIKGDIEVAESVSLKINGTDKVVNGASVRDANAVLDLVIDAGENATVELNNVSIDVDRAYETNHGAAIYGGEGAVITLNNVKVDGYYTGVKLADATLNVNDYSEVTASGTTSNGPDGIRAYGESKVVVAAKATVTGGTTSGCAIELYDKASADIKAGATVSGAAAVTVYGGTLVTAGNLTGSLWGICAVSEAAADNGDVNVTVTGGTVKGTDYAIEIANAATTKTAFTISGGTIEGDIKDYHQSATGDAKVVVKVTGACTFKNVDESGANVEIATGVTVTYDPARP